jgi:hypothetical protein
MSRIPWQESYGARPAGIEPATTRLEGGCSIRLSYGRICGASLPSAINTAARR